MGRPKQSNEERMIAAVIGYRIKKSRGEEKQSVCAKALNVKEEQLSRLENGHSMPKEETIKKLAKYYKRSEDYFSGNDWRPFLNDIRRYCFEQIEKASIRFGRDFAAPSEDLLFEGLRKTGFGIEREEFAAWYKVFIDAEMDTILERKRHLRAVKTNGEENDRFRRAIEELAWINPNGFNDSGKYYSVKNSTITSEERALYQHFLERVTEAAIMVWCDVEDESYIAKAAKDQIEKRDPLRKKRPDDSFFDFFGPLIKPMSGEETENARDVIKYVENLTNKAEASPDESTSTKTNEGENDARI